MSTFKFPTRFVLLGTIVICALGSAAPVEGQERKKARGDNDATLVKGTLASVDADKNTLTVTIRTFNRATQEGTDTNKTFPLSKDAKVLQDAVPAKLADLKRGFTVTLKLEGTSAVSVSVDGGTTQGEFRSANHDRNTITVLAGRDLSQRVYHLIKTTTVTGADGKEVPIKDLKPGTKLMLTRSVEDDNTVVRIQVRPTTDK